jgi:putative exosortase-associated protein (TIGR04073 family)
LTPVKFAFPLYTLYIPVATLCVVLNKKGRGNMGKLFAAIGIFIGICVLGGPLGAAEQAAISEASAVATQPAVTPSQKAEPQYESLNNPVLCFGRGIVNVSTCWLEIPRCVIYDNAAIPFFGVIVGIPEGALFTVARALTGVADIVSFGFIGNAMYGRSYPDFIWDANWMLPEKNKK